MISIKELHDKFREVTTLSMTSTLSFVVYSCYVLPRFRFRNTSKMIYQAILHGKEIQDRLIYPDNSL
jgi:hypothetical protein